MFRKDSSSKPQDFDHLFWIVQERLHQISDEVSPEKRTELQKDLVNLLQTLHLADVADIIEDLSPNDREIFIQNARLIIDAELLFNLRGPFRLKVLEQLGVQHFQNSFPILSNEDIFTLIETLPADIQNCFLELLPRERRKVIRLYLTYPEESVGRYMSVDFIALPKNDSCEHALDVLKEKADLPENFSEFFLIDAQQHFVGLAFLKDILRAPPQASLESVMQTDVLTLQDTQSKETASSLFSKYKNLRMPVLSAQTPGKIVGILRSDDILEIAFEEISEGILNVGGMPADPALTFWKGCFMRLRWIALTVVNALFSPLIIDQFRDVVAHVQALAVLMPLVASIGGVVGIQTVSVILHASSEEGLRLVKARNAFISIMRESAMGFLNGIIIGAFLGALATLWFHDGRLGGVLAISMIFSMTWAAVVGAALPLVAVKTGLDANLCSGPLITTLTDVSGYVIFLGLAQIFLF